MGTGTARAMCFTRNVILGISAVLLLLGCGNKGSASTDSQDSETGTVGGDTDSDGDADADADGDGDGDGDTDMDSDSDSAADTDVDSDGDGDTDADADGDTDMDVDSDVDGDTDTDSDSDSDADTDADSDGDGDTLTDVETATDSDTATETRSENPDCPDAIPIRCGDQLTDTTVDGRPNEWRAWNCSARGMLGPEKIYVFEPENDYEVDASLTDMSAELGLFLSPDCDTTDGFGHDEKCGSTFTFSAVAGETRFLVVDGFEETGGSYTLSLSCTETGDSDTATDTNVTDPPGFWRYQNWHGCAWALVTGTGDLDMIHPENFEDKELSEPYCVSGGIEGEEEFAGLGFNLNESAATADCGTNALVLEEPPPGVVLGGSGLALNYYITHANLPEFRIQLTSPLGDGAEGETWCADLTEFHLGGVIFIPYTDFNTRCWDNSGEAFDPATPISSVSFLIIGETYGTTFDFCIEGFAAGDSADDAPVIYDG